MPITPINQRSPEERLAIQTKGGKALAAQNAQRKALKEEAAEFLVKMMANGKSVQRNLLELMAQRSFGDPNVKLTEIAKFFELLRDTSGQSPTVKQEVTGIGGAPLVQKVFVTPEEKKETDEHIDKILQG